MNDSDVKRFLPWLVAAALFMEQLDVTIVTTAVPAMADSLGVTPLSLKTVIASYLLSLAVCMPASGWLADRYGSRRVFAIAIGLFTTASILCGLALDIDMLVAARILQGAGAAMMIPVGRLAIIRTFPKAELLNAMNFVIVPALIGPMLGPTAGGLIVHWMSWRMIFFVNVPVGLAALVMIRRYMPDYRDAEPRPLDLIGLLLFAGGTTLLSWLLGVFGVVRAGTGAILICISLVALLLTAYILHAKRRPQPLLRLALFRHRTFRVSVAGGFITRLGLSGMPFLLPLLYQVGLGMPAWLSGLMMMPAALAAIGMKLVSVRLLKRFGFRHVLIVNTALIGGNIGLYAMVGSATPLAVIVAIGLVLGFFSSLQFSSMNSMAYADIDAPDTSMASAITSTFQQISRSFGLAAGSLVAGWFLGDLPQTDRAAVTQALHHAFLALAAFTALSSLTFWTLRADDGESISKGRYAG